MGSHNEKMENMSKIRNLLNESSAAFAFQKDNYYNCINKYRCSGIADIFLSECTKEEELMNKDGSLWKVTLPPLGDAKPYSAEDLEDMTDGDLYIEHTFYGRLYVGFIFEDDICTKVVTIKTWDFFCPPKPSYHYHHTRFCNELEILIDEDRHPCLMKLAGFCMQKMLAILYEGKPSNLLSDEIAYGTNFGWDNRMKVAIQLADLVIWLQARLFRSALRCCGITIDEEFKVRVFDFFSLARLEADDDEATGTPSLKDDVYAFGVLLVELISKDGKRMSPLYDWIEKVWKGGKSIVDISLRPSDDEAALNITKLAMECLHPDPRLRPEMKHVKDVLQSSLQLVEGETQKQQRQGENEQKLQPAAVEEDKKPAGGDQAAHINLQAKGPPQRLDGETQKQRGEGESVKNCTKM